MRFTEAQCGIWCFFVLNGVLWVQYGSYGFFEVHLGSVRFSEVQ